MDFLFQGSPVWTEVGMLLHKCTGKHRIRAICEADSDDDTLIQPSCIPSQYHIHWNNRIPCPHTIPPSASAIPVGNITTGDRMNDISHSAMSLSIRLRRPFYRASSLNSSGCLKDLSSDVEPDEVVGIIGRKPVLKILTLYFLLGESTSFLRDLIGAQSLMESVYSSAKGVLRRGCVFSRT